MISTYFHTDPRYEEDLHRAGMAWALHAAARGLSREQIEHEILNGCDLSKKGPRPHQFDYAARTARKAIQALEDLLAGKVFGKLVLTP
jgi:hypothetical protein